MTRAKRVGCHRLRWAALTCAALLSACGGAGEEPAQRAQTLAGDAFARAMAPEARKRALAVPTPPGASPLAPQFVLYEEVRLAFPALFGGATTTVDRGAFTFRLDPTTGNAIALTATDVWILPAGAAAPQKVGALDVICAQPHLARFCGFKVQQTATIQGLPRNYVVHVPWAVRNATDVPVVFMLHGTSGTGQEFYEKSGWREMADARGFIAVFPTALRHCYLDDKNNDNVFDPRTEIETFTKWAWGGLGDPQTQPMCTAAELALLPAEARAATDHVLADDLGFFDEIVSNMRANFGADRRRIYVAGFSAGSQMVGRLVAERSTVIAAAAGSAGRLWDGLPVAQRDISVMFTVGEIDDRYTTPLGIPALPLTDTGAVQVFQTLVLGSLPRVLKLDPAQYVYAKSVVNGKTLGTYEYSTGLPVQNPPWANRLTVGVMQGVGHAYPNQAIPLAQITWDTFFTRYALP